MRICNVGRATPPARSSDRFKTDALYSCVRMYVTHKRACWDTMPLALRVKQPSAAARVTPLTSSQINLPHTLAFPSAPAGPRLCPLTENGTTSLPPARVASMYKPIELWCGAPPRIWTTMGCSNSQSGLTTLMWFHRGPRCFQLLPRSHSRQRLPVRSFPFFPAPSVRIQCSVVLYKQTRPDVQGTGCEILISTFFTQRAVACDSIAWKRERFKSLLFLRSTAGIAMFAFAKYAFLEIKMFVGEVRVRFCVSHACFLTLPWVFSVLDLNAIFHFKCATDCDFFSVFFHVYPLAIFWTGE